MACALRLFVLAAIGTATGFGQDADAVFRETLFSPPMPIFDRPAQRPANGPWNADVIVYRIAVDGGVTKTATFERAGVPTICRLKDGRLLAAHQHFPENDEAAFDKVAVHFSKDDGQTWSAAEVIQVKGLPEGMRFPFDPTLTPLPDGRVRLYFTGLMGRRFEEAQPAIHSAIAEDGVSYTYEPGVRFAVEGRPVIDCAAVLHQGTFHLFAPDNGTELHPGQGDRAPDGVGYHATSQDGLNFTRAEDVRLEGGGRRWLGNAESDGKAITFYGTGMGLRRPNQQSGGNVWMATSTDGQSWQLVPGPSVFGGDPGAVANADGSRTLVITGEPRRTAERQR